jgi:hypothetical protein
MEMEMNVKGRVLGGRHGWTGLGGVHQQRGVCREMDTAGVRICGSTIPRSSHD